MRGSVREREREGGRERGDRVPSAKLIFNATKDDNLLLCRIDRNVDEVQTNVEAAHTELLKYFKGITSNRWLMIKIFAVVVVFFIIFIVFLA